MPRATLILILASAATFMPARVAVADCPPGDLSRDCEVDFDDVRLFAEQWLHQTDCFQLEFPDPNCPDMDGVDGVNLFDLALITRNWHFVGHPIMINEFMASNSSFVQDPQGDYDDWLELYNASDKPFDVGGMHLTNKIGNPAKWRIPDDDPSATTIPAHGHLWIWTDEDIADSPGFHAGFNIDADGGELGLFDCNATDLIDSIGFDRQTTNISYGRYPDGAANWRYLASPTPGGINEDAYLGEVTDPQFSHKRGFYDAAFTLTIACETPNTLIYYTTDGSEPGVSDGRLFSGSRYHNPFPITETTILRARAVKGGWKPSRVKTHTYVFDADDATKSLPIVSLVGDKEETFYEPHGIMAIVGGYYSGGVWTSDGPGSYNNIMQHGIAYERPVSFEYFNNADETDFQIDCGVRVHGSDWMRPRYHRCAGDLPLGWTGDCKIAFRLYFRGRYGENRLEYPLFPYGLDEFESIVLRSGHNDRQNPFIKDELLRRLYLDMGNASSTGSHANVFVNGEYKGYYNPTEHIKDSYCREYYNSDEPWDVITMSGVRDGDATSWNQMATYARSHDMTDPVHYCELANKLDISAFADYLILQLWCANWDWPQNNWSAAAERSDYGMWRFFIWDAEGGMFSDRLSTTYFDRLNSQDNANGWLYRALKVSKDFRQVFTDRLFEHFYNNGVLTQSHIEKRFFELADEVQKVVYRRTGRYVDEYVIDTWIPSRLAIFFNACRNEGVFTYNGPELRINDAYQHGGYASPGDVLTIHNSQSFGDVYYTTDGNDPRIPPAGWSPGNKRIFVSEGAPKRIVVPAEPAPPTLGKILYEFWAGIGGTAIADLTSHPDYPANPTGSYEVTEFEGPIDWNNNYGCRISGYLHPLQTGDYTFWLATDDNGELWLSTTADPADKVLVANVPGWTASREWNKYPSQKSEAVSLNGGQKYYIEALMKEATGGDRIAVTWHGPGVGNPDPATGEDPIQGQYLSSPGENWTAIDYDDSSWNNLPQGTEGIGYETRPGDPVNYVGLFDYDIQSEMYNEHTTCYIRIPFYLSDLDFILPTLNIRCDDGFVAYLNGERVASQNFAGAPQWDSRAEAGCADSEAVVFTAIDLSEHMGAFKTGQNILAIQGLNAAAGSSDFLISAELSAYEAIINQSGGVSPSAVKYTTGIPLTKSTQIKARMLNGNTWSALTEADFALDPVAGSLRITEIMYHPQDTNDPDDPNEEFVELKNIGPTTINLNLVKFANGIDFTFGDIELSPGGYVLVVKDRAAFDAAYQGFTGVIAGEYSGSLDNGGEKIELRDAAGQTVCDFKYDDDWREATDGGGHSLTIIDAVANPMLEPESGLEAHWRFDDGEGAYAADSTGDNDGRLLGGAAWAPGKYDGALKLEGENAYVSLSEIDALTGAYVTVSTWVRPSELTGGWNPLLIQHIPDAAGDGYYLYLSRYKPAFSLASGGDSSVAMSQTPITVGEWHHIAGTNDGSNIRIYVDGEFKGAESSLGRTGAAYRARIGYENSLAHYDGLIDDMRIYNRALSEEEVKRVIDPLARWAEKNAWRASAYAGGSPGYDDSGIIPNPGAIVINEILAHSHDIAPDWIELHNTTESRIDIGGWYLSDSEADLMKYRFAEETTIDAGGYLVVFEDVNFGENSTDPGKITGFAFNENGDTAYLSSGEGDTVTGYRASEDFGASARGMSFGRYFKRSTGNYNFVAMHSDTPRQPNAYPAVGPVVITEIMYNPDWPPTGNYTNNQYEFVELHNITELPVRLYDNDAREPWKFTDGIDFVFPSAPGLEIPAGGYLLIAKDVGAYFARYGPPPFGVFLLGPYDGKLSDAGEKLELSRPGDVDEFEQRRYIRVDRVNYGDGTGSSDSQLWPAEADGGGLSLNRIRPELYGNDPNNWKAAQISPGLPPN